MDGYRNNGRNAAKKKNVKCKLQREQEEEKREENSKGHSEGSLFSSLLVPSSQGSRTILLFFQSCPYSFFASESALKWRQK